MLLASCCYNMHTLPTIVKPLFAFIAYEKYALLTLEYIGFFAKSANSEVLQCLALGVDRIFLSLWA